MNKTHKIELGVGLAVLAVAGVLLWRYEKSAHAAPSILPPGPPLPVTPQAPAPQPPPAQLQPPPPSRRQRQQQQQQQQQQQPSQQQPFGPGFLPQIPMQQPMQQPLQQPFGPGFLPQIPMQQPIVPQPIYMPVPMQQPAMPMTPQSQGFASWAAMIAQLGLPSGPSLTIRAAQHNLNVIQNAGLVEDGRMGARTTAAIRQFQITFGLPVTGALDLETRSALQYFLLSATMPGTLMTDSRGQTWTVPPLGSLPVLYTPISTPRYTEYGWA